MSVTKSVSPLSRALVHATARSNEAVLARHEIFIREKLLLTSVVLAAMPLSLAFHGVPSPFEAALFAFALLPLATCLLLARNGRLVAAQAIAVAGELAIALLLAATVGAAGAIGWLILATVELTLIDGRLLTRFIGLVAAPAGAAVLGLDAVCLHADIPGAPMIASLCAFAAAAVTTRRLVEVTAPPSHVGRYDLDAKLDLDLLAALSDAVAVFDAGGTLVDTETGCATLLGVERGKLTGRSFFDRINVADRPAFLKLVADAAHGTQACRGTLRLRAADADSISGASRHLTVELRARAVGDVVVAVIRDVTDSLRREAEMEDAHRAVDTTLRAKDHFLANMSHELRTPLNAIIGFSEMLGSRTMSPVDPVKQREYASIVHQSGQHLLTVVNAILDTSKIQAGTFVLMPEGFPPLPLLETCCEAVRPQAENNRVEIVRDVPETMDEIVADRRACRQIIVNLLSNAVKFTPGGGRVTLRVRTEDKTLVLTIEDTGIGIEEADLARLGDPFFQARSSLSRPYEGTGLGLSMVRGLVSLHGGSLLIESKLGLGTRVTVRLPLDCRAKETATDPAVTQIPRRGDPLPSRGTLSALDQRIKKRA